MLGYLFCNTENKAWYQPITQAVTLHYKESSVAYKEEVRGKQNKNPILITNSGNKMNCNFAFSSPTEQIFSISIACLYLIGKLGSRIYRDYTTAPP